ncbi:hypothetical protein M8818_007215 [Zalaria obscura]|uniref:Uncharacterized protein n=1 Tax=Zalaria obscura TaxID=2024903 RepID=A0ACC3S4S5_9PEZI
MPPRIPRKALQPSYQCPSCTAFALSKRTFTSSSPLSVIGPESPKYIEIPEPPQQTVPPKERVRGKLPVPRDIFGGVAAGRGLDKADPENVAKSTQEPTRQRRVTQSAEESRIAWKQRMAAMRRQNLREGIESLKERKVKTMTEAERRSKQRQEEREALLNRPEREDERLTNPSVTIPLSYLTNGAVPDPDRETRVAAAKQKVAEKEAQRAEERRDALHALYMQARDFITNEQQLNAAVEKAFGTPDAPVKFDPTSQVPSIWAKGRPDSVQQMLNKANGNARFDSSGGYASLTRDRVRRIAEELTGGRTNDDAAGR